jgi:SAM-dependent methyltransferase
MDETNHSMPDKEQTKYSFQEKWKSANEYQNKGSASFDTDTLDWILTRNGFRNMDDFSVFLKQFPVVLDAGCGNGRILKLLAELSDSEQLLYGIDLAAAEIARDNLRGNTNVFVEAGDLVDYSSFEKVCRPDFIYCQEVLHHTSDPKTSFSNLVRLLNSNGQIAIYVYKEKAPIREFTDDFVRTQIASLNHEEASKLMEQFAELGRVLSNLKIQVEIPEVSVLGISPGKYDLQRFIYHYFMKCYWNEELSFENNTMINFDWYHPSLCSRHTVEEVREWFLENNLEVAHEYVDEYGITMRGKKS